MTPLSLHGFHQNLGSAFVEVNGMEVVAHYGNQVLEHAALSQTAVVADLSFRTRLCLVGADRARFLHGQVTNDINRLRPGQGCYAALVTAKGKMQADLNVFCLAEEILLDAEPGLAAAIASRLEKYVVADDVQIVNAASHYGLLTVQGPQSENVIRTLQFAADIPATDFASIKTSDATLGDIYIMRHSRFGGLGFDIFAPTASLEAVANKLIAATSEAGGKVCGWDAMEIARIEAGIPRFGADMDETILPLECGLESRAVSYQKGCYIGQEVINRIHSIGHVNRELRGLRLADDLPGLPARGDKLLHEGTEVGHVTSATFSPAWGGNIALGYVRRKCFAAGTKLALVSATGQSTATVVELPFI